MAAILLNPLLCVVVELPDWRASIASMIHQTEAVKLPRRSWNSRFIQACWYCKTDGSHAR